MTDKQDATMNKAPIAVIEFTPQAWINDYAVPADPEGITTWEIPLGRLLAFCGGDLPDDDQHESDGLREMPEAPSWTREWSGPFAISIRNRDEIEDFIAAHGIPGHAAQPEGVAIFNDPQRVSTDRDAWTGHDPWEDHPDYPSADWHMEVVNGDTRRGYVDWVQAKLEADNDIEAPGF